MWKVGQKYPFFKWAPLWNLISKKKTITFFWSKLSKLHKKHPILHMTTTFFLKQGETRTNSVPIPHPLSSFVKLPVSACSLFILMQASVIPFGYVSMWVQKICAIFNTTQWKQIDYHSNLFQVFTVMVILQHTFMHLIHLYCLKKWFVTPFSITTPFHYATYEHQKTFWFPTCRTTQCPYFSSPVSLVSKLTACVLF